MSKRFLNSQLRFRLMYQPHPNRETLFAGDPSNLVNATQNIEQIRFDDLLEMRQVVWDLAEYIADCKPDLISFFARGGIPYLIPVMHVLERKRLYDLIDGKHFHLFPGLTWDGTIEGNNSESFFALRFGEVVRTKLGIKPLQILVIDTTNSGNSVNKAVAACQKAFEASGASRDSIDLKVVGIVNSSHEEAKRPSTSKALVTGLNRTAHVLTPSGYSTTSPLVDRKFAAFTPVDSSATFPFEVTYWITGNIPTEDNAELIGIEAVHESLSTKSEPRAGRLKIVYGNGEAQQGTGMGNLSSRLISLLSMPLDAMPWEKMKAIDDLPPLSDEDKKSLAEIKEVSEGGLRLFELEPFRVFDRKPNDFSDRVKGLMKIGRMLSDAEVYWLGTLDPTPRAIAPKVRASLEHGKCSSGQAVQYFSKAFPEFTGDDPGGDDSAGWWNDKIRSMPKEAFADDEQAFKEVKNDMQDEYELDGSNAFYDNDEQTDSQGLALDFVVTVRGVDEARKELCKLKSRGMSLDEIKTHLDKTWPVTADQALMFPGPTEEQAAMHFVLECGGWDAANSCLEAWIAGDTGEKT